MRGVARRINTLAVAMQSRMTVEALSRMDFAYAAPFDPILIAAEQALKQFKGPETGFFRLSVRLVLCPFAFNLSPWVPDHV